MGVQVNAQLGDCPYTEALERYHITKSIIFKKEYVIIHLNITG